MWRNFYNGFSISTIFHKGRSFQCSAHPLFEEYKLNVDLVTNLIVIIDFFKQVLFQQSASALSWKEEEEGGKKDKSK